MGLVEEVAGLRARADLTPSTPSMRAVGYRQVWEYLDGVVAAAEMRRRAVVATRRFANRQFTWLRAMAPEQWFDSQSPSLLQAMVEVLDAREVFN